MMQTVYFNTDGDNLVLRSRAEGDAGQVGDMVDVLPPGTVLNWPPGVTFDGLVAAKTGRIEVEDAEVRVIPAEGAAE